MNTVLWAGFVFHFPKAQMLQDLFDYTLIFYEGNYPL